MSEQFSTWKMSDKIKKHCTRGQCCVQFDIMDYITRHLLSLMSDNIKIHLLVIHVSVYICVCA